MMQNFIAVLLVCVSSSICRAQQKDSLGTNAYNCLDSISDYSTPIVAHYNYLLNSPDCKTSKCPKYNVFEGKSGSLSGLYVLESNGTTHFYPILKLSSCSLKNDVYLSDTDYLINLKFKNQPVASFVYTNGVETPAGGKIETHVDFSDLRSNESLRRSKITPCNLTENENISDDSRKAMLTEVARQISNISDGDLNARVKDIPNLLKAIPNAENPKMKEFYQYRLTEMSADAKKVKDRLKQCLNSTSPEIRDLAKTRIAQLPDVDKILGITTTTPAVGPQPASAIPARQ